MHDGPATIDSLIESLAAADPARRLEAAERLCRAGQAAAPATVPLVRACGDEDDQVREWSVAALEELGPPPRDALAHLVDLASDPHPLVGYWAITLLGRSGGDAAAATSALAGRLEAPGDPAVAQRAAWALGKIGPAAAAARPALERAAHSADPRLARLARESLESVGP